MRFVANPQLFDGTSTTTDFIVREPSSLVLSENKHLAEASVWRLAEAGVDFLKTSSLPRRAFGAWLKRVQIFPKTSARTCGVFFRL